MDTLSDNALMLKVKDGDFDKMGLLFERYHRQLFGFLFQMTRQREASEDMVQNVFYRMLKYRKGFTGHGEFKIWMFHLARNVLSDHFHKNKRAKTIEDLSHVHEHIAGDESVDGQLEKAQQMKILEKALETLNEENRELLLLCRYQELKYSEVAQILNISEGNVKVRVHRALTQLKDAYLKIER